MFTTPPDRVYVVSVRPPGQSTRPRARRLDPPSVRPQPEAPMGELESAPDSSGTSRRRHAPRPPSAASSARAPRRHVPSPKAERRRAAQRKNSKQIVWIAALGSTLVGLAIGTVAYLVAKPAPAHVQHLPKPAPVATAPFECGIATPAKRLAREVEPSVPLSVAIMRDEASVIVGFASAPRRAIGMRVGLDALDSRIIFRDSGTARVTGVVPRFVSGSDDFAVDRETEMRTTSLDARDPVQLTFDGQHLRVESDSPPGAHLWSLAAEPSSNPVVERPTVSGGAVGHAIAFRENGRSGPLWFGWLRPRGEVWLKPEMVPLNAASIGKPSVAIADGRALFAISVAEAESARWSIRLALVTPGSAPLSTRPFSTSKKSPQRIAPRVAALPDERWLLQWTEGQKGQHIVRTEPLSSELQKIGSPLTVSQTGTNAGAGALASIDARTLSLFLVRDGARHELWATVLECGL